MERMLDDVYSDWLYLMVDRRDGNSYIMLFEALYSTRFDYFVPHDENRAHDGIGLRREFIFDQNPSGVTRQWIDMECSMLEMLIALSDRMALQMDMDISSVFWRLMTNIDLDHMDDDNFDEEYVEEVLERVVDRSYSPDGSGGLFPLTSTDTDQRDVELIYQMYAYIMEIYN